MAAWTACAVLLAALPLAGCRDRSNRSSTGRGQARPSWAPRAVDKVALFTVRPLEETCIGPAARLGVDGLGRSGSIAVSVRLVKPEDFQSAVGQAIHDGVDLVILMDEEYLNEIRPGQADSLPVRLACICTNSIGVPIDTVTIRVQEAAYLCGLIACDPDLTVTRQAVEIGLSGPMIEDSAMTGFLNGARSGPLRVIVHFRPLVVPLASTVRQTAVEEIRLGADMIFNATPMPQAVVAAAEQRPGIFLFNAFSDAADLSDRFIASATVDMLAVFQKLVARARVGDQPGRIAHSLADGVVRLAINPAWQSRLSPELSARLSRATADILSGRLDVLASPGGPTTTAPAGP